MRRRAAWSRWVGLAAISLGCGGCQPAIPKDDLGKVVFEVPDIPGADQAIKIPDLDPKAVEPMPEH